jgi:hypothetical protein
MMNIDVLKQQIEEIVGVTLSLSEMDLDTWNQITMGTSDEHIRVDDRIFWLCESRAASVLLIEAVAEGLTDSEIRLISLSLTATAAFHSGQSVSASHSSTKREDELCSIQLGDWLEERIRTGELQHPIPEQLVNKLSLSDIVLPFLINYELAPGSGVKFSRLNNLVVRLV